MRVLVDTGPIVALFNRNDRAHAACVATWKSFRGPVETVWPVITEAMYLVDGAAIHAVLDLVQSGALVVRDLGADDIARIRELMRKYADTPMDFADACLVRVAERYRIRTVFTLDRRGFCAYAPTHVRRLTLLPKRPQPPRYAARARASS